MTEGVAGAIAAAMAVIGFVAVWIKVGNRLGKNEGVLDTLKDRIDKAEKDVASLKNDTLEIKIEIARFRGAAEAKLDGIKETVDSLKGGRRAAEKQG